MKFFFKQRQSYMTLLETLIALSLLSIMLTFVFGFFRELAELTRIADKAQKEMFQMRYVESRLGFIFERIVNDKAKKNRSFFFYTQPAGNVSRSTSLIFTFDNEVRLDPTFSGDVLGRLYVDSNQRLCLAIWPLHVSQPHQYLQQEVLLDHVVNVKYAFYSPPERLRNDKDIVSAKKIDTEKKLPEKDRWYEDEWLIGYEQMPPLVKMVVQVTKNPEDSSTASKMETTDLVFHFVLPSSENSVHHPAAGG